MYINWRQSFNDKTVLTSCRERRCPYVPWSLEEVGGFFASKKLFNKLPSLDTLKPGPEWKLRGQILLVRSVMRNIKDLESLAQDNLDIGLARTDRGVVVFTRKPVVQERKITTCPELFYSRR